jgi:tetratricopeptide (TPR) repeat protein
MKKILLLSAIFCYSIISAQIKTPQPSPTATITQKVGLSNISVEYSRPGAKGREIFGELVSYNKLWRTGANKATKITFNNDFIFGDTKINKGSYSLFTEPGKKKWKVFLNEETELWGVGDFDKEKTVCKLVVEVKECKDFTESFTIDFGTFKAFSAIMSLKWANTKIDIRLEDLGAKKLQKEISKLLNEGPSANDYYNGAKLFADNTSQYEMALKWINIAIEKRPDAFWMLYHKAKIFNLMGQEKDAIITANKTIEIASKKEDDYGYIKKSKTLINDIKNNVKSGIRKLEE